MKRNIAWLLGLVALIAAGALGSGHVGPPAVRPGSGSVKPERSPDLRWILDTSWQYTFIFELSRTEAGSSYTIRSLREEYRRPAVYKGTLDLEETAALFRGLEELPPVRRAELFGPGGTFTLTWLRDSGYTTRVGDVQTNPAYQVLGQELERLRSRTPVP